MTSQVVQILLMVWSLSFFGITSYTTIRNHRRNKKRMLELADRIEYTSFVDRYNVCTFHFPTLLLIDPPYGLRRPRLRSLKGETYSVCVLCLMNVNLLELKYDEILVVERRVA